MDLPLSSMLFTTLHKWVSFLSALAIASGIRCTPFNAVNPIIPFLACLRCDDEKAARNNINNAETS